jgi:ABC-type polar amino acid transport system ATPase subunit
MTAAGSIEVRGVTVLRGARRIADDVTFDVARGELVALRGASGSGKTTLLRAIAGLEPLAAGHIAVGDARLVPGPLPSGPRRQALYGQLGVVFQFHNLFGHLTALENVVLALRHVLQTPAAAAEAGARALLATLGVADRAHARPHQLSGGEAQRVAIARALALRPAVLLMDEPTASLDADRRAELAGVLRTLVDGGQTVVVATHDAELVRASSARSLMLKDGRIVGDDLLAEGAGVS